VVDARAAARAWVDAWTEGWPARDVEVIAARYRPDAPYRSHPFREPTTARAYLTWAFEEQAGLRFRFGEPVVDEASRRAVVEYWATISTPDGRQVSVSGTSVLRFDVDGLVEEHRDYWAEREGSIEAPPGFGA
jgi:ketosteroid isomerase-like protein